MASTPVPTPSEEGSGAGKESDVTARGGGVTGRDWIRRRGVVSTPRLHAVDGGERRREGERCRGGVRRLEGLGPREWEEAAIGREVRTGAGRLGVGTEGVM